MAASLSRTARKCEQPAMNLINSLDDHVDADTETLWLQEAERRYHEYREGHTQGRSADDAFANLLRIKIQVHPVDAFFLDKERHSHDMPDCGRYKVAC